MGLGMLHCTNRCVLPRFCVPSGGYQCILFSESQRTHTQIVGVDCNNIIKGVSECLYVRGERRTMTLHSVRSKAGTVGIASLKIRYLGLFKRGTATFSRIVPRYHDSFNPTSSHEYLPPLGRIHVKWLHHPPHMNPQKFTGTS